MRGSKGDRLLTRRRAVAAMAGGVSLVAAPAVVGAQTPLTVNFVQQRGLLYLPVDVMVTGGVLQQEATKLGLGKVEATATTLSGAAPIIDVLPSGSVDYGAAALPSLELRCCTGTEIYRKLARLSIRPGRHGSRR